MLTNLALMHQQSRGETTTKCRYMTFNILFNGTSTSKQPRTTRHHISPVPALPRKYLDSPPPPTTAPNIYQETHNRHNIHITTDLTLAQRHCNTAAFSPGETRRRTKRPSERKTNRPTHSEQLRVHKPDTAPRKTRQSFSASPRRGPSSATTK